MSAGRMLDRKDFICYHWYMHRIAFGKFTMGYPDAIPRLPARRVRVRTRKENVHPMKMRRLISAIIALLLVVNLSVTAFAAEWYLEDGDITVSAGDGGQTVSQGSSTDVADNAPVIKQRDSSKTTDSTITISTSDNATANVTIKDINISSTGDAIDVGSSSANITLEGDNKIFSESGSALHVSDGDVTISGRTATVAVDVWTRPPDSVSGTRWTRWTPDSNFSRE